MNLISSGCSHSGCRKALPFENQRIRSYKDAVADNVRNSVSFRLTGSEHQRVAALDGRHVTVDVVLVQLRGRTGVELVKLARLKSGVAVLQHFHIRHDEVQQIPGAVRPDEQRAGLSGLGEVQRILAWVSFMLTLPASYFHSEIVERPTEPSALTDRICARPVPSFAA